jgi:DNA-binding MarR family transcriptional regulator
MALLVDGGDRVPCSLARVEEGLPGPPATLGARLGLEPARISAALEALQRRELIARDNGWYTATPEGRDVVQRVVHARRERLAARLAGWSPEEHEELAHVLTRLARDLMAEPPSERAEPPREPSQAAG